MADVISPFRAPAGFALSGPTRRQEQGMNWNQGCTRSGRPADQSHLINAMAYEERDMAKGKKRGSEVGESRAFIIPVERIQSRILLLRGQKVILDSDLARLYGVATGRLNEQVKRNAERFPTDFMFRLTREEFDALMSQIATSNAGRGGRRTLPYAFTEHGAIMAASVLNSPQAVRTSVFVVRAFVRLRQTLASNSQLAARLEGLEKAVDGHGRKIVAIVDALKLLMPPPQEPPKEPFGFRRTKKH